MFTLLILLFLFLFSLTESLLMRYHLIQRFTEFSELCEKLESLITSIFDIGTDSSETALSNHCSSRNNILKNWRVLSHQFLTSELTARKPHSVIIVVHVTISIPVNVITSFSSNSLSQVRFPACQFTCQNLM